MSTIRCAITAVPATGSWTPGFVSGAAGSAEVTLLSPEPEIDPTTHGFVGLHSFDEGAGFISLDVKSAVQNWTNGHPNFGFVMFQRKEFGGGVGANDESCTSLYDVTLELQVRRFVRSMP